MALVKFYNGNTENLDNLPIKEGQIIFSVSNSNGSIYYDSSNSSRIKMTALADKAIADNLGNNIGNTYISNLTGTTSKTNYVITPKTASGNNKTAITIPAASSTIAGLMTTETQSFSGNKTFNQTVTFLGSADASLGSYTYPAITIGPYSSTHLEIDANEIMAKANASTSSELYLNDEGGVVVIGPGGMNIRGHIIPNATTRTLDIGSTNNYFRNVYGTNFYGTATNASQLTSNDVLSYTSNTVRYFNIHSPVGTAADANNIPTNTWWHILRFIRADGNKYYTDLAIPFSDNSIYYKRIAGGEVANTSNTALKGWVKVLDEINYTNYTVTKTGSGASGTWGINITGNAATATKLQTARTINGTSFNGTANITTTNWGSTRNFYIADASAAHTGSAVSVNGSSNVTLKLPSTITATLSGTASNAQWLTPNNNLTLGASGLQYFNLNGDGGTSPTANNTPTSEWYHILRMNHSNSAGYYADIAVPLNDTAGIYWRQIRHGTNYGWFKLLDSNNYTNYTVTKTGSGASGTWGINITGNAGTATKLQTSRKINGILFNGSFNIDTYVAQFNLGAPAGSTGWSKLGTWSNTEQCDTCYIWVFGGNGQNGQPYQNGELHIFIKDGYQNTSGATGAFGVTVTKYTNADEYEVQVRATSSNSCEVWVKAPYTYSSGKYIISIPTDTIWVHEGKYTPIEPTNGTLQLHEYFTILNNTSNAASATKLQTARTIRTNLSSTSTASFDGTANITPGITGTLSVSHGGTGTTSMGASPGQGLYNLGLRYSSTEPSSPIRGMVWLKPV